MLIRIIGIKLLLLLALCAYFALPVMLLSSKKVARGDDYNSIFGSVDSAGGDFSTKGFYGDYFHVSIPAGAYSERLDLSLWDGSITPYDFQDICIIGNPVDFSTYRHNEEGEKQYELENDRVLRISMELDREDMDEHGALDSELAVMSTLGWESDPRYHQIIEIDSEDNVVFESSREGTFAIIWIDPANPPIAPAFITPATASTAAGETIKIRGSSFLNPLEVRVGGVLAPMAVAKTGSLIEVELPAGLPGLATIEITTPIATTTIAGFTRNDP